MKIAKKIISNIKKFLYRIFLLFFCFIFFILSFNKLIGMFIHINKEINLPDVTNIKFDDAKNLLLSQDLYLEKEYDTYSDLPLGTIISQFPEPNTIVRKKRIIKVVTSKGINEFEMPDLSNFDIEEIDIVLKNYGFEKGQIKYSPSSSIEKNKIISHNPPPKTIVSRGEKIDIKVSTGLSKNKLLMPNLIGLKKEVANILLDNANIRHTIQYVPSDDNTKGIVISQNPNKDEEIKYNQKVIIKIGE